MTLGCDREINRSLDSHSKSDRVLPRPPLDESLWFEPHELFAYHIDGQRLCRLRSNIVFYDSTQHQPASIMDIDQPCCHGNSHFFAFIKVLQQRFIPRLI